MKIGNIDIKNVKLGNLQVKKVFLGINLIWTAIIAIIEAFKTRVLLDFGQFEAENCLETQLTELSNQNLLDNASLVITPNAYKETKLYSVVPSDATGDMDVIRATRATRVNSDGLVEVVPYNIFNSTEAFGAWTKTAFLTTINNTITAPNGTLTAETLRIGVSTSPTRYRVYLFLPLPINTYTASYYLKKANHRWIQLNYVNSTFGNVWANFDLEDGVIGNKGTTSIATITDVGNGWYRCTLQASSTTSISSTACEIIVINNTNGGAYPTYQSTVEEDVCYLWGAQLVDGDLPKEYLSVSTGFNIPRLDYSNGSCPSILVEPQRTNLVLHSQDFSQTYWNKINGVIVTGGVLSPDGNNNAFNLAFNGTLNGRIETDAGTLDNYSQSVWLKTTTGTASVTLGTGSANLQTFTVNDTWTRYTGYFLSGQFPRIRCDQAVDIQAWGIQLEVGTDATSYIPTTTSTVTRNSDIIRKTGISDLIGQTEGTIFCELIDYTNSFGDFIFDLSDGTTNNSIRIGRLNGNRTQLLFTVNGSITLNVVNTISEIVEPIKKIVIGYIGNNISLYVNGVLIGTNTTSAIPNNLSVLNLGSRVNNTGILNGSIKEFFLIKTRLSNLQLTQLTTL